MIATQPSDDAARDRAVLRHLAELAESQQWVHHVADLETGEVSTTPLDRPVVPLSRAERLALSGRWHDLPVIWTTSHRLSPRSPYQTSPLGWMSLYDVSINMPDGEDLAWWGHSVFEDLQPTDDLPGLRAVFEGVPQQRTVVTIRLSGTSSSSQPGQVKVQVFTGGPESPTMVRAPIPATFDDHMIDVTFTPGPALHVEVFVSLEPGIRLAAFRSITVAAQPILAPPVFAKG